MSLVEFESLNGVGVITLNDPGHRNAVSLTLAAELVAAVQAAAADGATYAVVITGSGPAFCAGADRGTLRDADEQSLRAVYQAFLEVRACPLPTVAAVNGPAVGAGLNLALACDVRVAGRSALFDARFLQLPIHPGGGHLWMLDRLIGPQAAAAMTLFDQPVDGERAVALGLAWSCVPDETLLDHALAFCARLAQSPAPELARVIKQTLRESSGAVTHDAAVELELTKQLASMDHPVFKARTGRA